MVYTLSRPQCSDQVFQATELNRKSGAVLKEASKNPVTIIRNGDTFALLRRDLFAGLTAKADQSGKVLNLIHSAFQTLNEGSLAKESPYGWLLAFDKDEIQDLVAEVLEAFRNAPVIEDGWEEIDAIIHEWHESAIAVLSDDLANAFSEESDEVLLSAPS